MRYLIGLALLLSAPLAIAACPDPIPVDTICLEWLAPTQNVDGSTLTDLDGFEVFWALTAGDWQQSRKIDIPDETQTEFTTPATPISIPSPGPGGGDVQVFFVMTAYDGEGNVSGFSNQVGKVVTFPDTQAPQEPQLLNVIINVDTSA
jgi:hypothetical protein